MQVQPAEEGSITPVELQAELDTLRSLRRRSISQPSEGIDPDLPPSPSKYSHGSPPGSPKQLHHAGGPSELPVAGPSGTVVGSSSLGRRTSGSSRLSSNIPEEDETTEDQPLADNLSELFWLPARLHPEIAPQEFRNFIRDQTRPENLLRRSGSQLGRRKSMLSRQYQPSDTETESTSLFTTDTESTPGTTPSISRRPSRAGSFRRSTGLERLTLADLQKLESIARQAAEEGKTGDEGEAHLKRLVRRSLSLNPAAILGVADQLRDEDDSYVEDDTDSPLIVPPPGSILRRSARTKIRKNSLLGDGGGHRFGPSKRGQKLLDSAMEDDPDRPVSGKRQVSISSLNSLEDERGSPKGERPTSTELRRLSPRSPRSPRSPEKSQSTSEPIPPQYIPPTGVTLAERMEATDLGSQSSDRVTLSPVRAGADMPLTDHLSSQPVQWTALSNNTDNSDENFSSLKPATPTTGSLRTTRRIGAVAQPSPELQPRTSSAASSVLSPPSSNSLQLAASPEQSTLQLFDEPKAIHHTPVLTTRDEYGPALPTKAVPEVQQGAPIQTSTVQQAVTPASQNRSQQSSNGTQQSAVKSIPIPAVSHPPRKAPVSPVQAASATGKEKEKKSTWAKLGLSRSSKDEVDVDDNASIASNSSGGSSTFGRKGKKTKKDKLSTDISPEKKPQAVYVASAEKGDKPDSSSSFFGGLFGSKKKSDQNEQPKKDGSTTPTQMQMPTPPPTASGMLTPDGKYINFYRLPIHIERAVYRLSHIKLANPRRPLYEQVLISNLMFWYLGVINKPVAPPPQLQQRSAPLLPSQAQPNAVAGPSNGALPGTPLQHNKQGTRQSGNPARPGLVREPSSKSGEAVYEDGIASSPTNVPTFDNGASDGQRPASHPPLVSKSPTNEAAEPDYNLRPRPQTMPAAQHSANELGDFGPLPQQESSQYRYQDYISTSSTEAPFNGQQKVLPNGRYQEDSYRADAADWSDPTQAVQAERRARRFSTESAETDDVRYDSRRVTADMDTYDIISAYADEERRKSILAQQQSPEKTSGSQASPSFSAGRTNSNQHTGAETNKVEERPQRHPPRHPAPHATPPRQSSVGAIGVQQAVHNHHQHASHFPQSPRHANKSPPPRSQPSHTLPTQS